MKLNRKKMNKAFAYLLMTMTFVFFFSIVMFPVSAEYEQQTSSNLVVNGSFDGQDGWQLSSGQASFNGEMVTSYMMTSVQQTVDLSQYNMKEIEFKVDVNNTQTNTIGWNGTTIDEFTVDVALYSVTGERIGGFTDSKKEVSVFHYDKKIMAENAKFAVITLSGIDKGFWAGFYGTSFDNVELIATHQIEVIPTPTPVQDLENTVKGTADEGWQLSLTAPENATFDAVLFASYGTPENYQTSWCNAESSVQHVADAFIGKNTGTIDSSNGIFGDSCPGTYKRLSVVLHYKFNEPTPTPTPTPEPSIEPSVEPSIEPSPIASETPTPEPSVEPSIEPTPTPEPSLIPSEVPIPSVKPEPSVEPTPIATSVPIDNQTPEPSPSIVPIESVQPTPEPSVEPEPIVSEQPQVIPSEIPTESIQPIESDSNQTEMKVGQVPSAGEFFANTDETISAAVDFVKDVFTNPKQAIKALMSIGSDMTPEEKQQARQVVVPVIIVNNIITGMATMMKRV